MSAVGSLPPNTERRWLQVTACDNIPPREGRAARIGNREVAIFNLGERFLAVDNRCPHRRGPLCDGIVSGTSVVCPLHAWKVSLETGDVARPADANARIRTYATRVEAGVVMVEWPSGSHLATLTPGPHTP
jgi:nitrite reductase (NADH) small subunit